MLSLILLDLDNTLYPESSGMDHDIVTRMNAYVARLMAFPHTKP